MQQIEVKLSHTNVRLNKNISGATVDEAGRSSVIIDNVTMSDAGTYMCIAENSVGAIRALSFIRIRGKSRSRLFQGYSCNFLGIP